MEQDRMEASLWLLVVAMLLEKPVGSLERLSLGLLLRLRLMYVLLPVAVLVPLLVPCYS